MSLLFNIQKSLTMSSFATSACIVINISYLYNYYHYDRCNCCAYIFVEASRGRTLSSDNSVEYLNIQRRNQIIYSGKA